VEKFADIAALEKRILDAGMTLASIDKDNEGQIIIYSGLTVSENGDLVPF
jgi:hypothetical protein